MKYMGSKNRISKQILPIILSGRLKEQYYIEPMVGGCNLIDKVDGNRIGADNNIYLISMWEALQSGWKPKKNYTKSEYLDIKMNKNAYPMHVVGYVGINCSYSGKWFGGYAGKTKTKAGLRDYQEEAYRNVMKQIDSIIGVEFVYSDYNDLLLPDNSIIYLDPPYEGTTKYSTSFDHRLFWNWVRENTNKGHNVFVSEYSAPDDFKCIWEKELNSSLSANGLHGGNKKSVERLFIKK